MRSDNAIINEFDYHNGNVIYYWNPWEKDAMLHSISIRNFRSILDATLELTYDEGKAPNGWRQHEIMPFLDSPYGFDFRRIPILAIYGANASGKTNLFRALNCLKSVVREGVERNFHPNRINRKYATTMFSVVMSEKDVRLTYRIEYDRYSITHESLSMTKDGQDVSVFSVANAVLNAGALKISLYDQDKLASIFRVECTDGVGRQNKTFLNCLARGYQGLSSEVCTVASMLLQRTEVYLHNDEQSVLDGIRKLSDARTTISADDALEKIVRVLRCFDFSLDRLVVDRHGQDERVMAFHRNVDGTSESFDFLSEESEGTCVAAGLVGVCLWALETGNVVFFDELDRSLHPLILLELVRLFKSRTANLHGAQLVFTLHDTTLLEDATLRVSEVAVVNNNAFTGTTLTRLSQLTRGGNDGVRNVHNFRKQYLEGILTGVPHPVR